MSLVDISQTHIGVCLSVGLQTVYTRLGIAMESFARVTVKQPVACLNKWLSHRRYADTLLYVCFLLLTRLLRCCERDGGVCRQSRPTSPANVF